MVMRRKKMGPLMGWLDAFMKRRKMEGFMYMVEEGCKLRQIALVSTHAPHTDEGDNTLDPKEDTDTVSTESTDHRLTSLNDISSAGSCEDDWARNPEFCSSGSSASVHIGCMDFPLRTIDRHLAELGQRALHKGLFLPSEDTVQAKIRVTGDQGQVWSSNPIFTREDDVDSNKSTSPRFIEYPHLPQTNNFSTYPPPDDRIPEGSSEEDEENIYGYEGIYTTNLYPQSLTFEVQKLGVATAGTLESVDFEVYTVDTPQFAMSNSSRRESTNLYGNMQECGVQTEESMLSGSVSNALSTSVTQPASISELEELHSLQESIEKKDQEIVDLFGFLSKELTGIPEKVSEAMSSVRVLQSIVEQKDLEIADLYSQMSQEMQHAKQSQVTRRDQMDDMQDPEDHSKSSEENGLLDPSLKRLSFMTHESIISPFGQIVDSPGNASSASNNHFLTALPCQEVASGMGVTRVASPEMMRLMSGSDYYEVELDYASARATQSNLIDRIKRLEEDLMQKELIISEKESVIKRLQYTGKTDALSLEVPNLASPRVDLWSSPYELENQTIDAPGARLQDNHFAQQNPPWDSARDESQLRDAEGFGDIISGEVTMKDPKVAGVTFSNIVLKKKTALHHL